MEFSEQVKSAVNIVDVVGQRVRLKRVGASPRFTGLCPFHQEKTPSFSVHSTFQFYKCFGCGEGGDVFSFVMKMEGVGFYEALKILAEQYNIPMPKRNEQADPESKSRAALYRMHEIAQEVFRGNLQSPAGAEAMQYLRKRGISPSTAAEFGVGYADKSGAPLAKRLQQEGFPTEVLADSGLVGLREDGSFYDRFRGRLMFPIHGETGKLIGFGGRALDPNEPAKYLNSPETLIYKKSQVLYNLHRAKDAMRRADQVVLVEGYMDVIGVYDAGVKEVVASCGTALTDQHVKLMRRHTQRAVVNYDPDNAGADATERSLSALLEEGMHIRILQLSGGLDPDEFVRQNGVDAYRHSLKEAPRFFDWLADRARLKFDFRNPEDRVEGFRFLVPTIKKIPDKLQRLSIAKDLAATLGVEERLVRDHFREEGRRTERRPEPKKQDPNATRLRESMLIFALLRSEQARNETIPALNGLAVIESLPIRQILRPLFDLYLEGSEVSYQSLSSRLDPEAQHLLATLALSEEEADEEVAVARARDCLQRLELENRTWEKTQLRNEIREAERSGDMGRALQLMDELRRSERS